ncbi:MAG: glycosyltransferase family 2 protein [Ilumatobacter sp.]|nr:glycosyltransferase family 2 protein [Ilumatobacter sp.]
MNTSRKTSPATLAGPAVSVLIPTRNRTDDLAQLIPSLTQQTVDDFEVLVLDQSDDHAAVEQLVDGVGDERIRHVPLRSIGKSRALNVGIRIARSDVLAFTDDDCVAGPHWIENALACERRDAIVFGRVAAYEHDESIEHVPTLDIDEFEETAGRRWRSVGVIGIGANMVAPAPLIKELGGFDVDLGPGGDLKAGEDFEITLRALAHGAYILRDPRLVVIHSGGRPMKDRVASAHIAEAFVGIGASLGKHARERDIRAVTAFVDELARALMLSGRAIVRRQRPTHLRRSWSLIRGFLRGARRGLSLAPDDWSIRKSSPTPPGDLRP